MLPISVLVFPIIGGYYLLIRAELFRYRQQRLEPQKLIFNSFLGGIILMIAAWIVTAMITYWFPSFVSFIRQYYPLQMQYFGTCVFSFIMAVAFTELSNLVVNKEYRIKHAIRKIGNEFERLCEECQSDTEMIQITLKNDKCYVGWILSLPIPTHSNYIALLPVVSGYRSKDEKKLTFTTQYLDVYSSYIADGSVFDIRDLTKLVIRIEDIVSANPFDIEMYERFKDNTRAISIDSEQVRGDETA
jgi:hypothetical protein